MSAKSLLRAGFSSPRSLRSPSTPKSILKRPPPLALSQSPFRTSVTIVVSPGSPHVHFPSSPGLTATYTTHSPNSYDRGAIVVSPNPLELPSWGSRIFSPGSETFGRPASTESSPAEELTPKFKTFTPPILSLSSPNFDEIFPKSPAVDAKPTSRASARFQAIAAQPTIRPISTLGDSLKSYPRSPYPSAPASPAPAVLADQESAGVENQETLAGRVPPTITIIGRSAEMVSSPLRQEFLTPVEESPQHTATAANTNSKSHAQLTQAFWQSMSLDESVDVSSPHISNEDPVASGLFSPGGMISPMIFATKEGVVWSPPRRDDIFQKKAVMDTPFKSGGSRAMVMSPSPEDPFSAFPSFSAVLSLDHGKEESIIAYPPPAVTVESAFERR
ncbi:hypothetical protein GGU11DRAFT_690535 [Lentinula aff. detonsa]|nr:hypothetical protein GGU11DRAFT_690535 [Lentinula aff. detonsa]